MTKDKVTVSSVYGQRRQSQAARPPAAPSTTNASARAAGAIIGVGIWWIGLLGVSWVFNVADWRLGRVALTVAAGGAVVTALLLTPRSRTLPRVGIAAAGLAAGLVLTGVAVFYLPPGYYRLRVEFHRIPDPPGWTSRNEQAAGNSVCFDECKSIERELVPDTADPDRAANTMTRLLVRDGYHQIATNRDHVRAFRKGQFKITYSYNDGQPVNSLDTGGPPRWYLDIEAWQGY